MKVDVTRSKLDELLAVGTELADLDYKRTVDLKAHHDTIEIIKDIGAFMDHGGYIVIGADDHGDPVDGIQPGQEALFDESACALLLPGTSHHRSQSPRRSTTSAVSASA